MNWVKASKLIIKLIWHLKKSSLEMLFIIGASKCVWGSMPPGITNLPFASIIRVLESPCIAIEVLRFAHGEADHSIIFSVFRHTTLRDGPTAWTRPSSIRTSARWLESALTTVPPCARNSKAKSVRSPHQADELSSRDQSKELRTPP